MTASRIKTRTSPLVRTHCSRAALAALGLWAVASGPVHAAPAGTTLPANTIPVLRGVVSDYSTRATFATATNAGGVGQTLTINQLLPKIILDWKNFDIGNGSVVQFIQPSSTSAVLNRIYSLDPTIIQGSIKANGQVYLVNQNGILFDRGAQVNVNTLVASSLNIDDKLFQGSVTTGGLFTPAFTGGYDDKGATVASATTGKIVVGANGPAGAAAPSINAAAGGAVVIIAPIVDNRSGIITSPDGQVILAAGTSAYLGFTSTNNSGFRGMLVQVTADAGDLDLSSVISNSGTITSERGNVTLAGLAINQSGRVSASTAMLNNGSIYLQANTLNDAQRGKVTLGAGSVTETPLDLGDKTTLSQATSYTPYRPVVQIDGATIDVEGRIASPSGLVTLDAKDPAKAADARVYLGAGSSIDASGAWSTASDASNLLTFKVTSTELKNAPDQQGGLLLGATVTVDLRNPSAVLDLSGYQRNQAQTLAQKAAVGGSVVVTSTGSVVQHADSTIDVAGGGVRYTGATESTTKLLGADGKLYDIGTAPEALKYQAIASSFTKKESRWGYDQTFSNLLMGASMKRPDYTEGADGGSLRVLLNGGTNGLVLDGTLRGGTTTGSQQLASAPRGASLVIGNYDSTKTSQDFGVGNVTFAAGPQSTLAAGFNASTALPDAAKSHLNLSTDVLAAATIAASGDVVTTGFGDVEVNANGRVTVPENVTITGPVGGSLTLRGNQVEIDGRIDLAAGAVTAQTVKTPVTSSAITSSVVLAQGASIDTRGTWVNNSGGASSTLPTGFVDAGGNTALARNGGSITLAGDVVDLQSGSTLDVSAGGTDSARGVFSGGNGGAISLAATQLQATSPLTLDGTLAGYGFGNGGSLAISTQSAVTIGSSASSSKLVLGSSFFSAGGFSSYSVSSNGDLSVQAGTVVTPTQTNLQIDAALAAALPSGSDVESAARFVQLPDSQRKATHLALASAGKLTIEAKSGIGTDVGAKVALSAISGIDIAGIVYAPGGAINIALTGPVPSTATAGTSLPKLEIGSAATVSTRGAFVATPNDKHLVQGALSAGGTVSLQAKQATIALDAGSLIDVSGTTQVVDMPSAPGAAAPYRKVELASNAGTVSIVANDAVALNGAIRGNASGSAAGGSFALTSTERGDIADPSTGRRIVVTQGGATQLATDATFKDVAVSVDKLAGAGFDKLSLAAEDQIVFADDATLHFQRGVTLNSKVLQVANGASVVVSGTEVALENLYGERTRTNPDAPGDFSTTANALAASRVRATAAGTGSFKASADTLDVLGSVTVNGVRSTSLTAANDLRLSGRAVGDKTSAKGATLAGGLLTGGNLTLTASQVYPTTGSTISVGVGVANADGTGSTPAPGGRLRIEHGTGTPGDVYSAGGRLTLSADDIAQDGVVKAPLGTLNLDAASVLTLGATSVTSVSANGLTVPYGETQDGVTWTYGALGSNATTSALTAPPAKSVALAAPAIDVLAGAQVDISGGGDIAAVEYVPSSTTSKNPLTQVANTYAIIPAARLSAAPIDPDIAATSGAGFNQPAAVYNSIQIGAGGAVPAGTYVLLPATYALLKGGYLVQLLTGSAYANLQAGQTATLQNGQTVVPGQMAVSGTRVVAANTIGVVVQPNSAIAKLGDVTLTRSDYFATLANASRTAVPLLPTDGGQLSIAASDRLTLNGTLAAGLPTSSSRSAGVDITANQIALVGQVGQGDVPAGYLQVDAGSLSRLHASLLIGGVRSTTASGELVTPTASDIVVANGAASALEAPELVLAATDSIEVRSGSVIEGAGGAAVKASPITIGGSAAASGAVLRVSNAGLVDIVRPATDASQGTIAVAAGATLVAAGSVALDATRTTTSQGTLKIADGGALSLVSGSVSLGETDGLAGGGTGLVLDNAQLAAFNSLGTLSIKSYGGIDLVGDAQVGSGTLANLLIDAASLTGHAAADGRAAAARIEAAKVTLTNSGTRPAAAMGDPTAGALVIDAGQITVGAGDKAIGGFADVQLKARGEILAAGSGSLTAASTLELSAARIGSVGGASQAWSTRDASGQDTGLHAVTISQVVPGTALADSTAIGSRLQITGSHIADGGTIVMRGGSVTLQAQGAAPTDAVVLASGAVIDAGGATKDFQGTIATADAGQVTLASANGGVQLASGSTVDVSAAQAGGNAGSLTLSGATVQLGGTLKGGSAAGTQGSVHIDVQSLADFSSLNRTLAQAGFRNALDVRVRHGDLTVAAGDVVQARAISLESDRGSDGQGGTVTIAGRLSASSSTGGGSIEVDGHDVDVRAGALIDARGAMIQPGDASSVPTYASGGNVTLVAAGGTLDFAAGATIDVTAGAKGLAGGVLLRAPRTGDAVQASLGGTVLSTAAGGAKAQVVIEGNRTYGPAETGTTIAQGQIDGYAADNLAWMGAVDAAALGAAVLGDNGQAQGNVQVRPAVEVQAAGDLSLSTHWDLTGSGWRIPSANGAVQAGTLVVRAAGDLTLASASIGNPDAGLQKGATWNIGLVSGADLGAANGLRTQSTAQLDAQAAAGAAGAGDLTLDSQNAEASVRTGTGAIHLAAGRDFVIKPGGPDANGNTTVGVVMTTGVAAIKDSVGGAPAEARFAQGGGDITISAQRDATGAGNEWLTEWYRSPIQGADSFTDGAWWAYRANFHDGVAAMGGGNVAISAGRDVADLSAFAPTSAIQVGTGANAALATYGGGDVSVRAGNDIVGGQYLVALGSGTIAAGGDVGGQGQASQVFVMGLGSNPAVTGAKVAVKAGNAITLNTIDNPSSLVELQTIGSGASFGFGLPLPVLSYSADSAVSLAAGGGDIRIGNRPADNLTLDPTQQQTIDDFVSANGSAAILPPKVDFTAFNGDIVYTGIYTRASLSPGLITFPSADGSVRILAAGGITHLNIDVSDADPTQFAIGNYPATTVPIFGELLANTTGTSGRVVTNTSTATFIDDVVALGGDAQGVTFTFPARSRIWAAGDISNPVLSLQNLGAGDVSEVVADQGAIRVTGVGMNIGGPGTLLLQAGQDISLGTGKLVSVGNTLNQNIADASGANIVAIAGASGTVDTTRLDATFAALIQAGNVKKPDDAQKAVDAFFKGVTLGDGNIDSYATSIQSDAGGSVNLLAPGGDITVGLPTPNANKLIGVVTNAGGAIRSYLSGNFNINQGKVLTAQGGDILIYTSKGGIDAGRGAHTSVTTPPPTRTPIFDSNGNLIGFSYSIPVAVAGSGIQTATSKPNGPDSVAPPAGNIYLFAPEGTIDAGEAGIASGGAIFIAALTVLNADNITSVGASTGVPQVAVGSVASSVAASGATTATGATPGADAAAAAAAAAAAGVTNFKPAILTVEVLGFGDRNCKETDKDCFAR